VKIAPTSPPRPEASPLLNGNGDMRGTRRPAMIPPLQSSSLHRRGGRPISKTACASPARS